MFYVVLTAPLLRILPAVTDATFLSVKLNMAKTSCHGYWQRPRFERDTFLPQVTNTRRTFLLNLSLDLSS
jgi:hypothetical protein